MKETKVKCQFFTEGGDMFNYPGLLSYAHGCNCAGVMGKGWYSINLGIQESWRSKATLLAINKGSYTMLEIANGLGIIEIGVLKINAGLGRSDWRDIKETSINVFG
ncbi:hypothetical protein EGT74_15390 [Chitinophaga lutea]|uniref:Uncharacterized protein n=1 Tax=Chitinophaga lutea TaxID=2488634 RepID=A0A3N4PTT9_9BACT|nr:hypothetical protein [Chitinophaga lutea]RPE08431.1 hypothetical protein EGT74_15390 [Chitinophaga lutea]